MSDIEFVNGLFVNKPKEGAPDFIKANISIKRKDLGNWLRGKEDDSISIVVKESKNGKWYAAVDNWKPKKQEPATEPELDDEIPF